MFIFRKIWCALFSWNTRFEIRTFTLYRRFVIWKITGSNLNMLTFSYYHSFWVTKWRLFGSCLLVDDAEMTFWFSISYRVNGPHFKILILLWRNLMPESQKTSTVRKPIKKWKLLDIFQWKFLQVIAKIDCA